ncbi:MAG: CapA family protein [Bacteroidaceae bacterium]|nr:CapA family protein [Bacteroidaceae bacterium]
MKRLTCFLWLFICPFLTTRLQAQQTLTIAMTGDIMLGTTYPDTLLPANNGKDLFRDAKEILRAADVAVGNLEGTLCDEGESTKGDGPYNYAFRMPTSYTRLLKEAGYDYLSMANNHTNDFGPEGIASTEKCLKEQGIACSGIEGRMEYAIVRRRGLKIGLCAFGHNSYTLKHTHLPTVARIVERLVEETDIVIVSFHGGAEGRAQNHLPYDTETFLDENRGSLRELAHFCIDHGADVVYGHGPHVARAVEVYKGRFIAYSLGNFCTPYGVSLTGISGYAPLVEITINGKGKFIGGKIHSMVQQRGIGPRNDKQQRAAREIKALSEEDVPDSKAYIDNSGNITLK